MALEKKIAVDNSENVDFDDVFSVSEQDAEISPEEFNALAQKSYRNEFYQWCGGGGAEFAKSHLDLLIKTLGVELSPETFQQFYVDVGRNRVDVYIVIQEIYDVYGIPMTEATVRAVFPHEHILEERFDFNGIERFAQLLKLSEGSLSREYVQELYEYLISSGRPELIEKLQEVTKVQPEYDERVVKDAYSEYVDYRGGLTKACLLSKLSGIPVPKPVLTKLLED